MQTVYLVTPLNTATKSWLMRNTDPENRQWFAGALAVEHHYIDDLLAGLFEAGLCLGVTLKSCNFEGGTPMRQMCILLSDVHGRYGQRRAGLCEDALHCQHYHQRPLDDRVQYAIPCVCGNCEHWIIMGDSVTPPGPYNQYMKGLPCPFSYPIFTCQEGYCIGCHIAQANKHVDLEEGGK